jgi:putative transposase
VGKQYQNRGIDASGLVVPERVSVALAEIAESAREGLLAVAVGAGLQVMAALMAESVTALAGPRGRHDPDRTALRHGSGPGSVTLERARLMSRGARTAADAGVQSPVIFCMASL